MATIATVLLAAALGIQECKSAPLLSRLRQCPLWIECSAGDELLAQGAAGLPIATAILEGTSLRGVPPALELVRRQGCPEFTWQAVRPWLENVYTEIQVAAARALGSYGKRSLQITTWILPLLDGLPEVREAAAEALASVGTDEAVPALLLLGTNSASGPAQGARRAALRALARIAPRDARVQASILRLLDDSSLDSLSSMRLGLSVLSGMGPDAAFAVPRLRVVLREWNDGLDDALTALSGAGPAAGVALPEIAALCDTSEDRSVREAACSLADEFAEPK